jgi:hypothetical protein
MACIVPKDVGSRFLQSTGPYLPNYTVRIPEDLSLNTRRSANPRSHTEKVFVCLSTLPLGFILDMQIKPMHYQPLTLSIPEDTCGQNCSPNMAVLTNTAPARCLTAAFNLNGIST